MRSYWCTVLEKATGILLAWAVAELLTPYIPTAVMLVMSPSIMRFVFEDKRVRPLTKVKKSRKGRH